MASSRSYWPPGKGVLLLALTLQTNPAVGQVIKQEALTPYPHTSEPNLFYYPSPALVVPNGVGEPPRAQLTGMCHDGEDYIFYGFSGDRVLIYKADASEPTGLKESSFDTPNQTIGHVIVKRFNGQNEKADGLRVLVMGSRRFSVHTTDGEELYGTNTAPSNPRTRDVRTTADPDDTVVYFSDSRETNSGRKTGLWSIDLNSEDEEPALAFGSGNSTAPAKRSPKNGKWTTDGGVALHAQVLSSFGRQLGIRRGKFSVMAVMPGTDFAATRSYSALSFLSLETSLPMRAVALREILGKDEQKRIWAYADHDNDQFIFVGHGGILFVPCAELRMEVKRPFVVAADFPNSLLAGRSLSLQLTQFDPRDRFELENAPEGMQLVGNTISYTPSISAAEEYTVRIACFREKNRVESDWTFRVTQQDLRVEFETASVRVTPNGRYALISGDPIKQNGVTLYGRLATIDLATQMVVADKQVEPSISALDVNDEFAFCTIPDGIVRYTLPDLNLDQRSEHRFTRPVQDVRVLGERRIVVTFPSHPALRIDQQTLAVVPSLIDQIAATDRQTAFGTVESGLLLDGDTGNPRLLLDPVVFVADEKTRSTSSADRWHPFCPPMIATKHLGYPAYAIPTRSFAFASPLVRMAKAMGNVCVETIDPGTGDLVGSYPLMPVEEVGEVPFGEFDCGANVAVVNRGRRLFILPLSELGGERTPFHIVPRQKEFIVREGPITLRYEAPGAVKFALTSSAIEGVQQPEPNDTGTFVLDLSFKSKLLWREGLENLVGIEPRADNSQLKRLSAIFKRQRQIAMQVFGEDIQQLLLPVRFRVEATNDKGELAILEHFLLVKADPKRSVEVLQFFESQPQK